MTVVVKEFFNRVEQVLLNPKHPVYAVLTQDQMLHLHPFESAKLAPSWSHYTGPDRCSLEWSCDGTAPGWGWGSCGDGLETILLVKRPTGQLEALSMIDGTVLYTGGAADVSRLGRDDFSPGPLLTIHQDPLQVCVEYQLLATKRHTNLPLGATWGMG